MNPAAEALLLIRPAVRADAPAIFALYRELEGVYDPAGHGPEPGEEALWDNVAADPRQQILVAERAGRITGSLTVVIVPNLGHRGRPWAAVENVVVARELRGQGVGTELMRRAGAIARANNCYKLTLTSNINRPEAHRFYGNLGWRRTHAGYSVEL
ncbi:MAG: GNAT family N-acetyltransferase [Peptococcaceae bacterium]|jgi:GNAT superfamily N-acetyltransferase|nr:GNAT family N-acetyltransferase [Peptococcaceae bacterium]